MPPDWARRLCSLPDRQFLALHRADGGCLRSLVATRLGAGSPGVCRHMSVSGRVLVFSYEYFEAIRTVVCRHVSVSGGVLGKVLREEHARGTLPPTPLFSLCG